MDTLPADMRPANPIPDPASQWDRNLAAYREVDARVSLFERDHLKGKNADTATEDRFSDLVTKEAEAFELVLRTPSPDLAAFTEKLRICVDDEMAGIPGAERLAAQLLEDLRRLTAQGRA